MSTPGFELATSHWGGKHSSHSATYVLGVLEAKFSYKFRYSRLECPKTPFFPSSVAHSHFDWSQLPC